MLKMRLLHTLGKKPARLVLPSIVLCVGGRAREEERKSKGGMRKSERMRN
jgi:hypothetical protein